MKIDELFMIYKYLIFSVLCFLSGILTLINQGDGNFYSWFILALSFGFLEIFFEKEIRNKEYRKVLIILSYAVAAGLLFYGIIRLIG